MTKFLKQRGLFEILILVFVIGWLLIFLLQKINLITVDLGRHLKNGELIFQGNFEVLKSNFYSYTYPDFTFVNHHWLSGVIFFLILQISGFSGLHLFNIILTLATFLIVFNIAKKEACTELAVIGVLLVIPLIAQRREIRPEIFSYLFAAIFFYILWHYKQKNASQKYLFVLPLIEVLWVNSHIYFFLGPAIMAAFLLEELSFFLRKKKKLDKKLFTVFMLVLLATLLNPFGLKGTLHPLNVYKNYGYRILEEQSVIFLERLGFIKNPNFLLFKIVAVILILSFIFSFKKDRKNFSLRNLFLGTGILVMAAIAIRNFTIFGFFVLPIMTSNLKNIFSQKLIKEYSLALGLIAFLITLFVYYDYLPIQTNQFGLGLLPEINGSIEFFKENNVQGPIFNNYDIGSYLIYHLFPEESVFVDNRPETYPASFFQDIYIPLQQNEQFWQEKSEEYQFNAIFFYRYDATPWAQPFLIERVKDPDWAPVFVDDYTIILLKRNEINQQIIEKYKIPQEYFKI